MLIYSTRYIAVDCIVACAAVHVTEYALQNQCIYEALDSCASLLLIVGLLATLSNTIYDIVA